MTPVPPPPGFLGQLVDMHLDFPTREIILWVRLPLHDMDGVFKTIGLLPGSERLRKGCPVALLPTLHDADGLTDLRLVQGALLLLEKLAASGQMPREPEILSRFVALAAEIIGIPAGPVE